MVKINGEEKNLAGKPLRAVLEDGGFNLSRIAVEKNGEIVPRATYDNVVLCDGDSLEVVSFVGGG